MSTRELATLARRARRRGRLTEGQLWALAQAGVITAAEFSRCRVARRATRPLTLDERVDLAMTEARIGEWADAGHDEIDEKWAAAWTTA